MMGNVGAIDGLVIPAVVLLGGVARDEVDALTTAQESVRVTRASVLVEQFVGQLSVMLRAVISGQRAAEAAQAAAVRLMGSELDVQTPDPVVACYIDQNFCEPPPPARKVPGFEETILANANAGGENVHRGLVLGACSARRSARRASEGLKAGLHHRAAIEAEIEVCHRAHR